MHKPTILFLAALLLAWRSHPVQAAPTTYWQLSPPTVGNWFLPGNWSSGAPNGSADPAIDNGGTARILSANGAASTVFVGYDNEGHLILQDGQLAVGANFYLGRNSGSTGSFTMSGNSLVTSPNLIVGEYGTGSVDMSGGEMQIANFIHVGSNHSGSMVQSNGAVITAPNADLSVGWVPGTDGYYELSDASQITVEDLNVGALGEGDFYHYNGMVDVAENVVVGNAAGSDGYYQIDSGSLSATRLFVTGATGPLPTGGIGEFVQNGGDIDVSYAFVAHASGGQGTYRLKGGTLDASELDIGTKGQGLFEQTGGTATTNIVRLRPDNLGISATYNLSDGELHTGQLRIGNFLDALFHQTGGLVTANSITFEALDGSASSQYDLAGGILRVGTLDQTDGTFNFTAGTLTATSVIGDLTNQGGTLAPGQITGDTAISGFYNQQAGGALAIDIGGTGAGQFDTVSVSLLAGLNGNLYVDLVGGFVPDYNDSFTILNSAFLLGTFSNAPATVAADGGFFDVVYTGDSVILTHFVPEPASWLLAMIGLGLLLPASQRLRRKT